MTGQKTIIMAVLAAAVMVLSGSAEGMGREEKSCGSYSLNVKYHNESNWGQNEFNIMPIAVGDIDQDGMSEIVQGGYIWNGQADHAYLGVWKYDSGTYNIKDYKTWPSDNSVSAGVLCLSIGDVDNNGSNELISCGTVGYQGQSYYEMQLRIWNYTHDKLNLKETYEYGKNITIDDLKIADIDGDGQKEIVVIGSRIEGPQEYGVLLVWEVKNEKLSLKYIVNDSLLIDRTFNKLSLNDVNNDGKTDIITVSWSYNDVNNVTISLWNYSSGNVGLSSEIKSLNEPRMSVTGSSIVSSDIDLDGHNEILIAGSIFNGTSQGVGKIEIWNYSQGNFHFKKAVMWNTTNKGRIYVRGIDCGNMRGGEKIFTFSYIINTSPIKGQLTIWNYSNQTLNIESQVEWPLVISGRFLSKGLGDTDNDGHLEIVTICSVELLSGGWGFDLRVWGYQSVPEFSAILLPAVAFLAITIIVRKYKRKD